MPSSGLATFGHRTFSILLLLIGMIFGLVPGICAQTAPAIPEYTGDRVLLVGNPRGIDAESLKREIAKIERDSRQNYFILAVKNTGSSSDSTKKFMDRLADEWPAHARKSGIDFDTKRVVVIVLGIENRKIVILGGTELQEKFGFRDTFIDRELVRPYFTPIAQKGDLTQALRVLVGQIDRWIASKDKEQALRQSEIAARSLQLRKEAESAIAEARKESVETQALLKARHDEGMVVSDLDAGLAQVASSLDSATARLDENPAEALDLTRQANRILTETGDQIRRIPLLRTELDVRLGKAQETFGQIAKAIDSARDSGVPTVKQEQALDEARMKVDQARALITTDPFGADRLVNEGEGRLRDVLNEAKALPATQAEITKMKTQANKEFDETLGLIVEARKKGLKLAEATQDVRSFETALARLRTISQDDPIALLSGYRETSAAAQSVRKTLPPKLSRHQLVNRTIPMAALTGLGALGAGVAGLTLISRRRYRRSVMAQFEEYRAKAVELMDRLDGLRKEHGLLMKIDPDFTEPSTGRTHAVYHEVEGELASLWDKWLSFMEVWERADKLVKSANSLNSEQIKQAKNLLETEGSFDGVEDRVESCRKRLADLGQAHEVARAAHSRGVETVADVKRKLDSLNSREIRIAALSHATSEVERVLVEAKALIVADPIGASEIIAQADETLKEVSARSDELAVLIAKSDAQRDRISGLRKRTDNLRRTGLILKEPEADPDPKLDRSVRMLELAEGELKKPEPETASRIIDDVEGLLTATEVDMKRYQEAREAVLKSLPEADLALASLDSAIRESGSVLTKMQESFAPASFQNIADNVKEAMRIMGSARDQLAEAHSAASDDTQKFLLAMNLGTRVAESIARANALVQVVRERHATIENLADAFRKALPSLKEKEAETLARFERSQKIIGTEARRSLDQAIKLVRGAEISSSAQKPDWPEAERLLRSAQKGLELAENQAKEDIEGHERVDARQKIVRQRLHVVGALLEQGDKDRPPANQRYRQAVELMRHFDSGGELTEHDWDERLRWLDEIAANVDRAEQLAQQDINLASGAASEIESAVRSIRQAQAYYKSGVSADVDRAVALLSEARGHLAAQNYESAVESAQAAEHAASVAVNKAEHAARKRRMQADRTIVIGDTAGMGGLFDVLVRAGEEIARSSSRGGNSGSWGSGGSSGSSSSWGSGGGSWGSGSSTSSWGSGGSSGGSWGSGSSQSSW